MQLELAFLLQEEDLVETLDDMGYEAHVQEPVAARSFRVVVARFRVQGMTCSTCVGAVEHALAGVRGVRKATVALATAEAEVEYDSRWAARMRLTPEGLSYGVASILTKKPQRPC